MTVGAADWRSPAGAERAPLPPMTASLDPFRAFVREVVSRDLAPHADEWERAESFPGSVFETMAAHGLLGLKYPREYGGGPVLGADGYLADAVLCEELARCGSGGVAAGIGAHIGIATPPVWKFGTDEQKARYLPGAIAGSSVAALAITEPDAGSDVAGVRTRARTVDGGYLVDGSKMYITNGVRADFLVVAVRTGPLDSDRRHAGVSFLIVDRGQGVRSEPLHKLGWQASDTAIVSFEEVFVPSANLLGREGEAFVLIMANFQWERLLMALGAVGAMETFLERTLELARSLPRRSQSLRHRLASCAVALEGGRAITYHALRLFCGGQDALREVTMAKLATQRTAFDVLDACLQVFYDAGAHASEEDVRLIERAVRDARLGPIGGGTDEIMREILGRSLGL